MLGAWYNENWLLSLVTLAGVLVTAAGAVLVVIQLRAARRRNAYDLMVELDDRVWSKRFPGGDAEAFYGLAGLFSGSTPEGQLVPATSLRARVVILARLGRREYEQASRIVRSYVNTLNPLAEALEIGVVDERLVLGRWHMNILREAYIAEPFILLENVRVAGRWGRRVLKLSEAARRFNDQNPRHGGEVSLDAVGRSFLVHRPSDSLTGSVAARAVPGLPPASPRLRGGDLERWQERLVSTYRTDPELQATARPEPS